jgi:alanine racemase
LQIVSLDRKSLETEIALSYRLEPLKFSIPFIDDASVENAVSCCSLMIVAAIDRGYIQEKMQQLQAVTMRLELIKGINHCSVINDSYSADLSSLTIALNFLDQQSAGSKRTVILSDFLQTGLNEKKLYEEISALLNVHHINKVIAIGKNIGRYLKINDDAVYQFYDTTEEFLQQFRFSQFRDETILIKGARIFGFERIVHTLEQKVHQTVLEINLNAIAHNLKEYQKFS